MLINYKGIISFHWFVWLKDIDDNQGILHTLLVMKIFLKDMNTTYNFLSSIRKEIKVFTFFLAVQ